ncbi:MAG: DNA polymerase III gamma and tau [Candidatus Tokpelaia hoelldobleri]|uniref:DNA polymerase III subunit gamma/tau n=1 Tax=Candidatus Tokpelaia hoelldobleri TaxID=1902579 RepID=A0A1U9JSY2_9HYPH|nr:MAG: DNA polymerase III gamma and tau [Candidatus Tokpelaia hoelldoblerii]
METDTTDKTYRVLARKYRPKDFSDLIGQEPMVRTLTNAFEAGRIAQAWMLTGVRGVGKTTTARILARALNYKTDTIDKPAIDLATPGEHCQAIMEGPHVDVGEMDAASHTGIDDIREIIEQVRYRPVTARYKVYIIDEVHMLSTQAFNGLLKTLEEPPPHVKFIFATTEIRKVPITVLSRCQRFDLRRVSAATLTQHLQKIAAAEHVSAEDEALAMIARAGEGSVRDALSIMDQAIAHGNNTVSVAAVRDMLGLADKARIIGLFELIMRGDVAPALRELKAQYDGGADPAVMIAELAEFNHLVTRLRFTPELGDDPSLAEEERKRGKDFAARLSVRALARSWQMLLKGMAEVENAPRPLQAAEMLLIRLAHAADLPTLDEALQAIAENRPLPAPAQMPAPARKPSAPVQAAPIEIAPVAAPEPAPVPPAPVVIAEPLPVMTPAEAEKKNPRPENLKALIALADTQRDIQLKFLLKEYVRLVKLEGNSLTFEPAEDAPRTLSQQLGKALLDLTGERWIIKTVDSGGGATVAEEEKSKREALLSDAENDADVIAIQEAFPGAKVVDVRLNIQDDAAPYEGGADFTPPDGDDNALTQDL